VVNRKGPQTGSAGVFTNPQTTQAQTSFSFGTQNKTPGFVGLFVCLFGILTIKLLWHFIQFI